MIFLNESELKKEYSVIAGVDEAGRGPLIGPVVIAAVILNGQRIEGLNDSKMLTEKKREILFEIIMENALCWHIEIVPANVIDDLNILQATLQGMKICVNSLSVQPDICLFDGNVVPSGISYYSRSVVKGDSFYASISAASVLAKVTRDRLLIEMDKKYPQYNLRKNKGYPTAEHLAAIEKHGITPEHRRSYKPVHLSIE
ncbi:MAG: ribonuclease HII, partial [Candidatus Cloacimonetes bacterium]|nr:ribonuclease HII [Candidatus Cloacimonadota bacterium]